MLILVLNPIPTLCQPGWSHVHLTLTLQAVLLWQLSIANTVMAKRQVGQPVLSITPASRLSTSEATTGMH